MPTQQRTRGIAATVAGQQKLQETKAAGKEDGTRLTFECIADRISRNSQTSVDPRTIRRFFNGEGIDRDYVLAICTALGLEVTEIVDPNEWHPNKSRQTPQPVATSATLNTTPPTVDEWQGRQTEISELQRALGNDNIRLIGITAAGGYGKSALAVKLTEQLTLDWRVLWVSFTQAYGLAQFGRWLLEQLGQPYDEKWDEETLIQQMVQGLTQGPCLLVLDNLETVVTADADSVYGQFLSRWLATGRNSKLLLTSREKPSFTPNLLRRCHWLALQGLAEADAMRLVTVDYGLTGTESELARFVNQMGRHPLLMQLVCSLMVEQFGAGVTVTAATQLGLDLFSVSGYHRDAETSVGEVVAASLARLSPRLGTLLKRLSVLRIAFDLSLAQGLAAEVTEPELRHLARLSLLQESPPEPLNNKPRQFQLLPLIQMFVQQQADSEVLRVAHQSALAYFLAHLPSPPWKSLDDLTAYLEAFYHAIELGQFEQAYEILTEERGGEGKNKSVDHFLHLQGFYRQEAELYKQVVAGSQREQKCYRNSLNLLGNCYDYLGQYEKAIAYHQQCHDISEEMGDRQGVAMSLSNLGVCYDYLGQYEKAIAYHQQSHDINEEIGNRQGVASSLDNLGLCYHSLGRYEEAIPYHQQSLTIEEEIGNRQGVALSLVNLGICYKSLGQYEKAIAYHQQCHDISEEIGAWQGVAISLHNIGETLIKLENYSEAETKIQASLVISQAINFKSLIAHSFQTLAEIAHQTNQPHLALSHCQAALTLSQELGIPLVKDCEELLAKIQATLAENPKPYNNEEKS
ncbi:tetratricopeptide repeat protein [Synechococcus sp. PCC 6312]|uniref:tetratricopeptide repeat protein n=1 Tax=Synechococcus sp. (strain ATCC 27167 / PCC 6312) TaxID=195253 RepID=UPI00029EF375|nr:tetratricopeptide repeat protein [Synechococcus sp. PCC 6312]AFY61128.1 ATP-dependent transcriptional regulator [Synechococcus sp. PCC 6312]